MLLVGEFAKQRGRRGVKKEGEDGLGRGESSVAIILGIRNVSRVCVQQSLVYLLLLA